MKKFLLGLLSGFVLAGLTLVILAFSAMRLGENRPSVPAEAILTLHLNGELPERAPLEIPIPFFQSQQPQTMLDTWQTLRKAAVDSRIKGVLLVPADLSVGWARLQELREAIIAFKKSGKPVYAFLRTPSAREYYLATAADQISMTREDILNVKGIRAQATYLRRIFDKLGVQMQIEHAGKYKDAGDEYTQTQMSPATREVLNSMLDIIYGHLVDTIASGRGKQPQQIRDLMDQGPFLADKALEAKLVDILGYEEQAFDGLKAKIKGRDLRKISQRDYVRVPASSLGLEGKTSFALVVGEGTITRGGEVTGFSSEEGIRSQPFIKMLRDVGADSSVKGVILRINSPGGDAIASEEILQEVRSLSRKKPMVISMSDLAASGGYYMAMTGDPIVSYSNTITGSIGVVFGKPNFKGFFEKVGIDHDVLKRGKFADIDTVIRPMTEEERAKLREGIDYIYRNFLARVSEGRKRQVVEIAPLAEGRAWMGAQAHDRGLVDELGGLDRAIELLKRKANVNASEKVRLVAYPRKKSLFEQFLNSPTESTVDLALRINARRFLAEAGLGELDLNLMSLSGYLKIAPYQVDFK